MSSNIIIAPNGDMVFIHDDDLAGLMAQGRAEVTRASNVEPAALLKRLAFRVIRRLVSDQSRMAGWTRTWRGPWVADMAKSDGPVLRGPDGLGFALRSDALAAEVEWLNREVLHV